MIVKYSSSFIEKVKKLDVRVYKSLRKQIHIFSKDPYDPILRNHELHGVWKGYRSINITADFRALYEEVKTGDETIAYFSYIGTHKELYGW